jgi:hypothetical protein
VAEQHDITIKGSSRSFSSAVTSDQTFKSSPVLLFNYYFNSSF